MSSSSWIFSLKVILISTGAISIAMAIRFSVPSIMAFALYELPNTWTTLSSWLKPPYLYVIINVIIITIVASSRFHHRADNSLEYSNQARQPLISAETPPPSQLITAAISVQPVADMNVVEAPPPSVACETEDYHESEANIVELKPIVVNGIKAIEYGRDEADHQMEDDDEAIITRSVYTPSPQNTISPVTQLDLVLPAEEKPLLSSRLAHRKLIKTTPEGEKAARPKSEETLESTWKKITEGSHVPLTRQLKKLDTRVNRGRHIDVNASDHVVRTPHVLKSETFRDRTNYDAPIMSPASWSPSREKIKKELSLSQDELNHRVEAFIKKFNEEMRLQRQESLNQYMEMINRGAY